MKRVIRMITTVSLVIAMLFSMTVLSSAQTADKEVKDAMQTTVLLVVAPKDFEDFEIFETKTILETNGAKVVIASTTTDMATGSYGRTLVPDIKISDAKATDYDAIVIGGGTGIFEHIWDNKDLHKLVQDANEQKITIGAICAAPVTLSKAGIMDGVTATMFPWDDAIKELTKGGAIYINDEVVVSGNIVTGRNVDATRAFALKLCDILGIRPTQKNVLMVIAPKDFEDVEVLTPKTILETNGAKVTIASTTTDTAYGSQGSQIEPDISIKDAKAKDYDAVVIPGGTGVVGALWDNKDLHKLLQDANKLNITIAAMCAAPPTLSKAGIMKDKAATMFPWEDGIKELVNGGAIYIDDEVVVAGNVVTARNPQASVEFGKAIAKELGLMGKSKKALMVISPTDFMDSELFEPKAILEASGVIVTVASTTKETAKGMLGGTYTPDITINQASADNYDALIIVGGNGVPGSLWYNDDLHELIRETNFQSKIVSAICVAPVTLSKAGIMRNKNATMYPWDEAIAELTRHGANYINEEVVVSGNIVTGRNPDASRAFGLKLAEMLACGKEQKDVLLVVSQKDYEDRELFSPKTLLEMNGAKVTIASVTRDVAKGMFGSSITPDIAIAEAKATDYDAVIVIGGNGSIAELWDNEDLHRLLKEASNQNSIVGAICGAPPVLTKAGIMSGRKATMFPWDDGITALKADKGVVYVDEEVVVSRNIITGRNADASEAFGLELCQMLDILNK